MVTATTQSSCFQIDLQQHQHCLGAHYDANLQAVPWTCRSRGSGAGQNAETQFTKLSGDPDDPGQEEGTAKCSIESFLSGANFHAPSWVT